MQPSTAEYWHIGAMTMRFARVTLPTMIGVNSFAIVMDRSAGERGFSCVLETIPGA
jgi:hypothetical protein